MRSFVLLRIGRTREAREAAEQEARLADRLGAAELEAMAAHDRALVALAEGEHALAARAVRAGARRSGAPISRPLDAPARAPRRWPAPDASRRPSAELRATALEPVRPSDFPATLVARMARVQGLIAAAGGRPRAG